MTPVNLNDLERIGRLLDEGKIDQNDYALLKQQIIKGAQPELTRSSTEDSTSAPSVSADRLNRPGFRRGLVYWVTACPAVTLLL